MSDELKMSVTSVCGEPGSMYAYVRFEDSRRFCEWKFPDISLEKNHGFNDEEIAGLKFYIQNNMTMLKKMAAQINVFEAFKS